MAAGTPALLPLVPVHILVSEGGLREDGTAWRARARLDKKALMPM